MLQFAVRRLVGAVLTVLVASFVIFAMARLLPGDEVRALFGIGRVDPVEYARIRSQLHLDEPFLLQYAYFLRDLVQLDYGRTIFGTSVRQVVLSSLQTSALLLAGVVGLHLALAPAVVWVSGRWPRSQLDRVSEGLSVLLVSVPVLVAAILVQAIFGHWLELTTSPSWSLRNSGWQNVVPPVLALGLGTAAHLALVGRDQFRTISRQTHTQYARAVGLPPNRIIRRTFRPAAGQMIHVFAANLAAIGTGLIIVEDVFAVPGFGFAILQAIRDQDGVLLTTLLVVLVALAVLISTAADVLHAAVDPRVRDRLLSSSAHPFR